MGAGTLATLQKKNAYILKTIGSVDFCGCCCLLLLDDDLLKDRVTIARKGNVGYTQHNEPRPKAHRGLSHDGRRGSRYILKPQNP